jgi:hypothetical protein
MTQQNTTADVILFNGRVTTLGAPHSSAVRRLS